MKPSPYGPFPYSPITQRPPLQWPNGARIAFWIVPNIEFFSLETRPGGIGPGKIPDIPTWAVRDYGNRVGVFRIMEVLDRHKLRASVALNSDICLQHPEIIEEGNKRGWEWMGHNQSNSRRLNEIPPEEEGAVIRATLDTIERVARPAARLAWLRLAGDMGNVGPSGQGRRRLCLGLGTERRSALSDACRRKDVGLGTVQLWHQ